MFLLLNKLVAKIKFHYIRIDCKKLLLWQETIYEIPGFERKFEVCHIKDIFTSTVLVNLLANAGKARGCSTNTSITYSLLTDPVKPGLF